jgi:hypothetical protein
MHYEKKAQRNEHAGDNGKGVSADHGSPLLAESAVHDFSV